MPSARSSAREKAPWLPSVRRGDIEGSESFRPRAAVPAEGPPRRPCAAVCLFLRYCRGKREAPAARAPPGPEEGRGRTEMERGMRRRGGAVQPVL